MFKTDITWSYYYNKNKNGITYYYSYKDKVTKQSKKIFSCNEHTSLNLREYAINITNDIFKNEIKKTILKKKIRI